MRLVSPLDRKRLNRKKEKKERQIIKKTLRRKEIEISQPRLGGPVEGNITKVSEREVLHGSFALIKVAKVGSWRPQCLDRLSLGCQTHPGINHSPLSHSFFFFLLFLPLSPSFSFLFPSSYSPLVLITMSLASPSFLISWRRQDTGTIVINFH